MKLKPAENKSAFLRAGLLGFAGAGKSYTAAQLAIGLKKYTQSPKPVAFFDTENGSDYLIPLFKREGVELLVIKSRSFLDLMETSREAAKVASVFIVDSVSHVWTELVDAFQKQRRLEHLTLRHWQPIKQEWRAFTDFFLNAPIHVIVCGRAGWEYDYEEDEEGVKELVKTGTRMKTEGELAYEPSILIEMERVRAEHGKLGQAFKHRAWVLKDKNPIDSLTGKCFDDPTFEDFLPHIKSLNIGGIHEGVNTDASSKELFNRPESRSNEYKRREIAMEELQNELLLRWPGQTAADKKAKVQVLKDLFGTGSWTALGDMAADKLEAGLQTLKQQPAGQPAAAATEE